MYCAAQVARITLVLFQEEQISAALIQKQIFISVARLSYLTTLPEVNAGELNDGDRITAASLQVAFHLNGKTAADRLNTRVRPVLDADTFSIIVRDRSDYYYG